MNDITDILLNRPLPQNFADILLFILFELHLILVLLAVGIAMIAFYDFINGKYFGQERTFSWNRDILHPFTIHKSVGIVIGVGALLLIQVNYTVTFFTGITLFAPYWLYILILLLASLTIYEIIAHWKGMDHFGGLLFGFAGLTALMAVPGIFAAVLVASENPGEWVNIMNAGFSFGQDLTLHWLARYIHVLLAAFIFSGLYILVFNKKYPDEKKKRLKILIINAFIIQIAFGILLYFSIPGFVSNIIIAVLTTGAVIALLFLVMLVNSERQKKELSPKAMVILPLAFFTLMLMTRQLHQNQSYFPMAEMLKKNSAKYENVLAKYNKQALENYDSDLKQVLHSGDKIYYQCCAFCHGTEGMGRGTIVDSLEVQPEALAYVRTDEEYLMKIFSNGVNGTPMPYFTYFDEIKLENLIEFLKRKFNISGHAEYNTGLSDTLKKQADSIYSQTCSVCHGKGGSPTDIAKGFSPPPPDFNEYTLTPKRAGEVIKNGYHGTMMPAFDEFSDDMIYALARNVNSFYKQ